MERNTDNRMTDHAKVFVSDASYDRLDPVLGTAIESLSLESWYKGLRGKKVFLKPNMLGLFEPEKQATTDPRVVAALVRLFREAGAKVTVGDNCGVGGYGLNQRVAKRTGIEEAADGAYSNVAQDTIKVDMDSRYLDSIVVSRAMLEADVLVSIPKMKTHSLTVVTGAVKNMFGLIAGAGKGKAHASAPGVKDFGRILADIFSIRPPDLTVMDGIAAMEGSGPSSGTPKQLGKILVSDNAVALDSIMCAIMGIPAEEVHHIRNAAKKGHGPIARDAIDLIGALPKDARFKLPVTIQRFSFLGRFVNQRFFNPVSKTRLKLNDKECKKCKICVEGCPTGAMHFDEYPWIDEDVCIRCLCCHELCPEDAWKLTGLLGRWSGRRL